MKKRGLVLIFFALMVVSVGSVAAQTACDIGVTLLNQDPYPAVPGEYVKVVFQITEESGGDCGRIIFEVVEDFPFSLDPGVSNQVEVVSGTHARNFDSSFLVPYDLRVDENAIDGNNPLDVRYYREKDGVKTSPQLKQFDINVDDVSTNFEITVQDYNSATGIVTFEIINVGENDVGALTVDILKQENIQVTGTNREIVGDLDSGEDTTFRFATSRVSDGNVELRVSYNDQINERRIVTETVEFDSSYFAARNGSQGSSVSGWFYAFLVLVVLIIVWWIWQRRKKRKERLEKFNKGKR